MAEEAPALKRDSTMAVTAKVSKIIEKRANGENGVKRLPTIWKIELNKFLLFFVSFSGGWSVSWGTWRGTWKCEDKSSAKGNRGERRGFSNQTQKNINHGSHRTGILMITSSKGGWLLSVFLFKRVKCRSLSRLFIFRKVVISLVIKSLEKLDQRRPPWKMRRTRTEMKTKKTRPKTARKKTTLKRTAQTNQLSNAMGQWLWLRR